MSKKTQTEIPADMWLHVASDALARYAAAGGGIRIEIPPGGGNAVLAIIINIAPDDPRLAPAFSALIPDKTEVSTTFTG